MSRYTTFEGVEVIGSWKNRRKECVPDFSSRVHVGKIIAVKSGVRELERERMRLRRNSCRPGSSQWKRYATREFRRAVSFVIAIVKRD